MKFQGNLFTASIKVAVLGIVCSVAVGCSQTTGDLRESEYGNFTPQANNSIAYTVRPGDSLSKIARRLTSSESNWEEIAKVNNITNARALQAGTTLLIPNYMLPERENTATTAVVSTTALVKPAEKPVTTEKPGWVFQPSSSPGVLQVDVILHAVRVNRTFDIYRVSDGNSENVEAASDAETIQLIRVVGSYYPKGIYTEPTSASTLMLRVAPGSTFEFERKIGDWLRIKTDKGIGYIRDYDAEILGASKVRRLIVSNHS